MKEIPRNIIFFCMFLVLFKLWAALESMIAHNWGNLCILSMNTTFKKDCWLKWVQSILSLVKNSHCHSSKRHHWWTLTNNTYDEKLVRLLYLLQNLSCKSWLHPWFLECFASNSIRLLHGMKAGGLAGCIVQGPLVHAFHCKYIPKDLRCLTKTI
jgi:hypothetical protein